MPPPKLLAFLPCEKVIIDQDNNVSLITLLSDLKAGIPESSDDSKVGPTAKIVAPIRWAVFAMWSKVGDDGDTEYEQKVTLLDPSGETTLQAVQAFRFADKKTMRNTAHIIGFPIHASGRYLLKLSLHQKGKPDTSEPVAEFPLNVIREQPKSQD